MSVECLINSFFSSLCIRSAPASNRLGHQLGHANKIIGCSHPPSSQLGSVSSSEACFPKTSHGLHPTKDLFDPFSNPLTEGIAFMTRGSPIDGPIPLCARCWPPHEGESFAGAKIPQSPACHNPYPRPDFSS